MKRVNIVRLFIAVIAAYFVMRVLTMKLGNSESDSYLVLDDYITSEITRTDGTKEYYESNKFDVLNRGDILISTLKLPKEKRFEDAAVIFRLTNCKVDIYYKDELLYSYGDELYKDEKLIGCVYPRANIPDEAWGEELVFKCTGSNSRAACILWNVVVMKQVNIVRYSIIGREIGFLLYTTTLIVACMFLIYLLFRGKWDEFAKQGLCLASFCILVSVWIITYSGIYLLFSENMNFYGHLEYIAFFCVPIPLLMLIYKQQKSNVYRFLLKWMIVVSIGFFAGAIYLNYMVPKYHYPVLLMYYHVILIIDCMLAMFACISMSKDEKKEMIILFIGLFISIMLFAWGIIRYNLVKYLEASKSGWRQSSTEMGITIFMLTLILTYVNKMVSSILGDKEKSRLEVLAYHDGMTNLVNRAGCYEKMKEIDETEGLQYTVVYFDINNLKMANDVYGHQIGDALIICIADCIYEIFGARAFCGRLGGDEFMVITERMGYHATCALIKKLEGKLAEVNESGEFPFKVSVSYGIEFHNKTDKRVVEEVINAADASMYVTKKLLKQ